MKQLAVIDQREVLGKDFKIYGDFESPLFLGSDVAEWIDYSKNPDGSYQVSKMVSTVDEGEKLQVTILLAGQNRSVLMLTEDGLYEVLMQSRKPIAKQFKKQVKEILKTIRKHGLYATDELLNDPDLAIKAFTALKEERTQRQLLEAKVEQDKPKVLFADSVQASSTSILIRELAKLLKQNGIDIGQNRLFEWLREKGYLISKKGSDFNSPTQKAMDLKLFEVKETAITHSGGVITISKTAKISGKGQLYFVNKFLNESKTVASNQ